MFDPRPPCPTDRRVTRAPDAALAQDVAPHAHDREIGRARADVRHVVGLDVQRADAVRPDAPGETAAAVDRHGPPGVEADAPAVEQHRRVAAAARHAAEREGVAVLEEELALLGKEQAEPRQVDLLLVGLDLREIGVEREVGDQVLRDGVLHVEPRVAAEVVRRRW